MTLPKMGGSYVRKPDGTLERVAGTERTAPPVPALAARPATPPPTDASPATPSDPATGKKGEK